MAPISVKAPMREMTTKCLRHKQDWNSKHIFMMKGMYMGKQERILQDFHYFSLLKFMCKLL